MHRILQTYLDQLREELKGLPFQDQDAVLGEVRRHLEDAAATHKAAGKSTDEAMLQATHDFGAPAEIGVQYGPEAGVFDKTTGEVILRVAVLTGRGLGKAAVATGKAAVVTGRGLGKVLKWTAIVLGALLLVGVTAFLVIAVTYEEAITESVEKANVARTVYDKKDTPASPTTSLPRTEAFTVSADASSVQVRFTTSPQAGCVRIRLTDPDGGLQYDNGDGCMAVDVQQTYTRSGTWRVEYTYVAFQGTVTASAYQTG